MTYNVNFPVRQIVIEPVNEAQANEVPVTVVLQAREQEDECPKKRNRHTFVAVEDKRCPEEYDSVTNATCRHTYSSS